jgi:hypothetical protein
LIRIRDHRGRKVPVRRIRRGRFWAMLSHSATIAGSVVVGAVALVYAAWFFYRVGATGGEPGPGPFGLFWIDGAWAIALLVAGVMLWVPLLLGILRGAFRRELVAGNLVINQCGACGYNLNATATASDGCTVCPECGAAWKLPKRGPDGHRL